MKTLLFYISMAAVCAMSLGACKDAVIPEMSRDLSDSTVTGTSYDLTSSYEFKDENTIGYYLDVNPRGISIKSTKEESDGSILIMLGGTNVTNGIPDALHEVYYPPTIDTTVTPPPPVGTIVQTDFPIDQQSSPSLLPPGPADPRALENSIALGSVQYNPKYTAVTISGMIKAQPFVQVREENESLRLLTRNYIDGYNAPAALFNPNRKPMYKELVYYQNPNYFSGNGYSPQMLIFRGRHEQKGGFPVLIWDGASPKQAVFNISYDYGKTFKKTVINWEQVAFAKRLLSNVAWETLPDNSKKNIVNPNYTPLELDTSSPPTTTLVVPPDPAAAQSYILTYKTIKAQISEKKNIPPDNLPPPACIAEGMQPVFTPLNATDKEFYVIFDPMIVDVNDTGNKRSLKKDGYIYSYSNNDDPTLSKATIEIADRIRVTANKSTDDDPVTGSETFTIGHRVPMAPYTDTSGSTVKIAEVRLKVNIEVIPAP